MRYLFLILFTVSLNAQILPSQQATHYKKNIIITTDTWDSSEKADCITLSDSNLTATEVNCPKLSPPTNSWFSVYGSTGVSSGTKEWELTIGAWDNFSGNSFDVMVGVTNSRTNENTYFPLSGTGSGYILENGWKHKGSGSYPTGYGPYGSSYGIGDVVKISLNLSTLKITFYKNGVSQGEAYTVNNGTYYLAASYVNNTNASITITGGT